MATNLDFGFVAVHCGAGNHPVSTRSATLLACKAACEKAYVVLAENNDAVEACVAATLVLEDDPVTNAGVGSNLTLDERVECDAGLMEGKSLRFGGVGCVRNVKNPISVCGKLLHYQDIEQGSPLVAPTLLAGHGALEFARQFNLITVSEDEMMTGNCLAAHRKALKAVQRNETYEGGQLLDTVGVIVVNNRGEVAASCSSGGPLLKLPGRIGHAAHFGCGTWAEQRSSPVNDGDLTSVAVSCTGCGEYLIRTSLARSIGRRMLSSTDDDFAGSTDLLGCTLRENFLDSYLLAGIEEDRKIAGAVALKAEMSSEKELLIDFAYGHCSPSMCLAYTVAGASDTSGCPKVRCVTSECPKSFKVVSSGGLFKLKAM